MRARSAKFHEYIVGDVLAGIEGLTSRAMFGGYGLYKSGVIFGIIVGESLYFKVNASNRADYLKAGSAPFQYEGKKGKKITLSYWEVPIDVIEDRQDIEIWAEKAYKR